MESITRFITTKLKLKVNELKSAVARPWERKFLGFSFTASREPKAADRAESGTPVQGAGPGTDEPDAGCEYRTNGRGPVPVSAGLARVLREVRNAIGAGGAGTVGPAQIAICDLEAVETGNGAVPPNSRNGV